MARARLQPPHHVGHVALPSIQRKPVSQRGADADAQQLHSGRLHHLRPGHGGQNHLLRQEWRGEGLSAGAVLHAACHSNHTPNGDSSFGLLQASVSNCLLVIGQEPKLAFEDVDATELYPCVMFYSSNPGEKVRTQKLRLVCFTSNGFRVINQFS